MSLAWSRRTPSATGRAPSAAVVHSWHPCLPPGVHAHIRRHAIARFREKDQMGEVSNNSNGSKAAPAPAKAEKPQQQQQQQQQQDAIQPGTPDGGRDIKAAADGSTAAPDRPEEPALHDDDPLYAFHEPPDHFDPRDKATPDSWIKRNPHLIRLTGNHPLNANPPAELLAEKGFITPVSLHYVRNHGAVPKIDWNKHRIVIDGLIDHPLNLSMDELLKIVEPVTVTSYMACTGTRRKELRQIKPVQGSDMGRTTVANSHWTGIPLSKLLQKLGVQEGAHWVNFSGPEGELPEGKAYETSLELERCTNPADTVMLAFKQNDRLLTPDHGFPLRLIAPGLAGGRQIKWLAHVHISDKQSTNHYNVHDNRRFPESIDREEAEKGGYYDVEQPEKAYAFRIMEDCVNSAILLPNHDEVVLQQQQGEEEGEQQKVLVQGYAYTGGGREVTHVEVSLDQGSTWRLATITHGANDPDHVSPNNKHYCWYLWEVELSYAELADAPEIRCRACDSAMNTQPERPMWNMTGMMNNCQYVVKLHPNSVSDDGGGGSTGSGDSRTGLRFEHPVTEGVGGHGGWMMTEKEAAAGGGVVESAAEVAEEESQGKDWESLKVISQKEVEEHSSREKGVWFVRDGKVYDATPFLDQHPGGASIIESLAGQDATDDFDSIHDDRARKMAVKYLIGRLEGAQPPQHPDQVAQKQKHKESIGHLVALNPRKKVTFKLAEKQNVSHDTRLFRFALPTPNHRLGLPIGKHIQVYGDVNGETVVRPYTPTTLDNELGHFDLVVKVYPPAPPKYPEGGKMSQHLDSLEPGDTIEVRGPAGDVEYHGGGQLTYKDKSYQVSKVNMIGGGTGITPLYQVAKAILQDQKDSTKVRLLYANKTPDDILLKDQLDDMAQKSGGRFQVDYTVDTNAPENWPHKTGHVSTDMTKATLFMPMDTTADGRADNSNLKHQQPAATADGATNNGDQQQQPQGQQQQQQQQQEPQPKQQQEQEQGQGDKNGSAAGSSPDGAGQTADSKEGPGVVVTLLCGPPPMIEKACKPALKEMGFEDDAVIEF